MEVAWQVDLWLACCSCTLHFALLMPLAAFLGLVTCQGLQADTKGYFPALFPGFSQRKFEGMFVLNFFFSSRSLPAKPLRSPIGSLAHCFNDGRHIEAVGMSKKPGPCDGERLTFVNYFVGRLDVGE